MKKKPLLVLSALTMCVSLAASLTACSTNSNKNKHGDNDHVYVWSVETAATCETDGVEHGVCSCGDEVDRPITKLGHDYSWSILTPATCEAAAVEKGVCTHDGCNSETTRDSTTSPALGHDLKTVVITEPTCEKTGTEKQVCDRDGCDYETSPTVVPATGHDYTWTTVSEATCTHAAVEEGVCENDPTHKATRDKADSPALGHTVDATAWNIKIPSATENGVATNVCTRDSSHNIEVVLPKTTEMSKYKTYEVTTEPNKETGENGVAKLVYESECGDIEFEIEVAFCEHDGELIYRTIQPATCEEDGIEEALCPDCNFPLRRAIPAPGHKYTTTVVKPTLTTVGTVTMTCGRDSSHKIVMTIPTLDMATPAGIATVADDDAGYTFTYEQIVAPGKISYGYTKFTYINSSYPDQVVEFTVTNNVLNPDMRFEIIDLIDGIINSEATKTNIKQTYVDGELVYEAGYPNYVYVSITGYEFWIKAEADGTLSGYMTSTGNGARRPVTEPADINRMNIAYSGVSVSKLGNAGTGIDGWLRAVIIDAAKAEGVEETLVINGNTYSFVYSSYKYEFVISDGLLSSVTATMVGATEPAVTMTNVFYTSGETRLEMPDFDNLEGSAFYVYYATKTVEAGALVEDLDTPVMFLPGISPADTSGDLHYGFFVKDADGVGLKDYKVQFINSDGKSWTYDNNAWALVSDDGDGAQSGMAVMAMTSGAIMVRSNTYVGTGTIRITYGEYVTNVPIICPKIGPGSMVAKVNSYNETTNKYTYTNATAYTSFTGNTVTFYAASSSAQTYYDESYTAEITSDNAADATLTYTEADGITYTNFVASKAGEYTIVLKAKTPTAANSGWGTYASKTLTITVKEAPALSTVLSGTFVGAGVNGNKSVVFDGDKVTITNANLSATFSYSVSGLNFALTYVSGMQDLADSVSLSLNELYGVVLAVTDSFGDTTEYVLLKDDATVATSALEGTIWGNSATGKAFKFLPNNTIEVYSGSVYGTLEATVTYTVIVSMYSNGSYTYKFTSFKNGDDAYPLFAMSGSAVNEVVVNDGKVTSLSFSLVNEQGSVNDYTLYADDAAAVAEVLGGTYRSKLEGYIFEFGANSTLTIYEAKADNNYKTGDVVETLTYKLAVSTYASSTYGYALAELKKADGTDSDILSTKSIVSFNGTAVTAVTLFVNGESGATAITDLAAYDESGEEKVEAVADALPGTTWIFSNDETFGNPNINYQGTFVVSFEKEGEMKVTLQAKFSTGIKNYEAVYSYALIPTDDENKLQFSSFVLKSGTRLAYSTTCLDFSSATYAKQNYAIIENGEPVALQLYMYKATGSSARFVPVDYSAEKALEFIKGSVYKFTNYYTVNDSTITTYHYVSLNADGTVEYVTNEIGDDGEYTSSQYTCEVGAYDEVKGCFALTLKNGDDQIDGLLYWNGLYSSGIMLNLYVIPKIEDSEPVEDVEPDEDGETDEDDEDETEEDDGMRECLFTLSHNVNMEYIESVLLNNTFKTNTSVVSVAVYTFEFKANGIVTISCDLDKFSADYKYSVQYDPTNNGFKVYLEYVSGHLADAFFDVDYFNSCSESRLNYTSSNNTVRLAYCNDMHLTGFKDNETGAYGYSSTKQFNADVVAKGDE